MKSWTLKKNNGKDLEGFELWIYRRIFIKSFVDGKDNECRGTDKHEKGIGGCVD